MIGPKYTESLGKLPEAHPYISETRGLILCPVYSSSASGRLGSPEYKWDRICKITAEFDIIV